MREEPDIARIASLVGDPARANMLTALMDGGALTASELALEAGVTMPTASSHLAKLVEGGLLTLQRQGRHRYYALSGHHIAAMLETISGVAERVGPRRARPGPRDAAMREARICYDHLAGDRGVALYDSLLSRRILALRADTVDIGPKGQAFFDELGIDLIRLSLADIDDPETANRILALHNRLSLQADDVDFLAALGRRMLVANPVYRRIARAQPSRPSASAGEGPPAR